MATLRGVLAGVLAAILAGAAWAEDDSGFVRERGDLDRLAIRGAKTFSEAEIKAALAINIDVAAAARTDAPLEALRKILADRTLAGYLHQGFVDATVEVQFDRAANQLVMEIEEGPQYLAGEVKIEGLEASLADRLREILTVEKPSADAGMAGPQSQQEGASKRKKKVVWAIGEPARLNRESQSRYREKIEAGLYDCGRLFPQFVLDLPPDRQQRVVELKVHFSDSGSPAQLDEFAVRGNKKLSDDDIAEFLGIQRGMSWTGETEERLERRLKQSGRFEKVKVRATKPAKPGDSIRALIEVAEYAKAPPLSQPLSREEQALVKLSEWLHEFPAGGDDLLITAEADHYAIEAVISPRFGALFLVRKRQDAGGSVNQPAALQWAFVTSDERIGFYSAPRDRKLVAIPTPTPVVAQARLSLHEGPPKFSGQGEFSFGLGMVTPGKRSRRRHLDFHFTDTPVSLLSLAHEYDSKLSWEGDVLTVDFKEKSLKFNGKTGQLIEFADSGDDGAMRLVVAKGMFERKLAELDAATRELVNDAEENAERPLSSVLEFLADEALACDDLGRLTASHPHLRMMRRLVSLGLLKPLDRLGVAACQSPHEKEDFSIPCDPFNFNFSGFKFTRDWLHHPQVQKTLQDLTAALGLRLEQFLLPAAGWPQAVAREAIYAQAQKAAPADCGVDLIKLCASPDAGPLCCLTAAAAAQALPLGAPAPLIANLGKTKLSRVEFQRDFKALLDADSFLGEYLLCLAEVLRGLEADEVETLAEMLKSCEYCDQTALDALVAVAAVLRQHREAPIADALAATADEFWQLGLGTRVASLLDALATEPQSPASAPPSPPAQPAVAVNGNGGYQAARDGTSSRTPAYSARIKTGGSVASAPRVVANRGDAHAQAAKQGYLEFPPTDPADPPAPEAAADEPPLALDGYSPVTLVELRKWRLGDARFSAVHGNRTYRFASEFERKAFLRRPESYRLGNDGFDIVEQTEHQRQTAGKREFGLFCNRQILLFASKESRARFEQNWRSFIAAPEQPPADDRYGNRSAAVEPAEPATTDDSTPPEQKAERPATRR